VSPTSCSLLDRLKVAGPEASDWNRLQGIYLPLIKRWLSRVPGLGDESADLAPAKPIPKTWPDPGEAMKTWPDPGEAMADDVLCCPMPLTPAADQADA
jgi:hypothetical protein